MKRLTVECLDFEEVVGRSDNRPKIQKKGIMHRSQCENIFTSSLAFYRKIDNLALVFICN